MKILLWLAFFILPVSMVKIAFLIIKIKTEYISDSSVIAGEIVTYLLIATACIFVILRANKKS